MAILIANENGDWWLHQSGDTLWVMDTDDLPEDLKENWEEYNEMDENLIYEFGKQVRVPVKEKS